MAFNNNQSQRSAELSPPVSASAAAIQAMPTSELAEQTAQKTPLAADTSLLVAMWPSTSLTHQIVIYRKDKIDQLPVSGPDEACSEAAVFNARNVNCGFTFCEYAPKVDRCPDRPAGAAAFWLVLNVGDKGYASHGDARASIHDFCYTNGLSNPTHIVDTGASWYVCWTLTQRVDFLQWQPRAIAMRELARRSGLLGDLDQTSKIATAMLIPGTTNFAMEPPTLVTLLENAVDPIERDAMLAELDGALHRLASQDSAPEQSVSMNDQTQVVKTEQASATPSPLAKFSLIGQAVEFEQKMVDEVLILGQLALRGQATVFYAAPNTGKTLITLHLLLDGINRGVIDPSKLYYINVDDSGAGLAAKLHIADEYGFHTIVSGREGFEPANFAEAMRQMIAENTASYVVIVLDTLKNFADLMDKKRIPAFTQLVRKFTQSGGTLIALAHTNKHAGANGKPVYAGTSDIVDDFDCAYTVAALSQQPDTENCAVQFSNVKRRGNVASTAGYEYAVARELTYAQRLVSVRELDTDELRPDRKSVV